MTKDTGGQLSKLLALLDDEEVQVITKHVLPLLANSLGVHRSLRKTINILQKVRQGEDITAKDARVVLGCLRSLTTVLVATRRHTSDHINAVKTFVLSKEKRSEEAF